jgi:hypothetical protein
VPGQKQLVKVVNETGYNTNDLRKICRAAAIAMGVKQPKKVEIKHTRQRPWVHGRARYGNRSYEGYNVWLWIPQKPVDPEKLAQSVARVMAHEFMHSLGVNHKDMTKDQKYCCQSAPWAEGLVLRKKDQKEKPKETAAQRGARLREERAEHARDMLRKATTRLKRAKTIEKKWRERVRYYEKAMAKAAGSAERPEPVDG